MFKNSIIFLSLILLFSCGKTADQQTADAVLSANIALSKGNCQEAIDTLEANGRVNNNSAYLKTLASGYACRAGYSTLTFFTTDITKTTTPAPLGGTSIYSTSSAPVQTTLQNDSSFKDLQTAINILLYAGGIDPTVEPTTAERKKHFPTSEVADIDSELLYMTMVQLGRYMHFYGNGSAAGLKGKGAAPNNCFTTYANANAAVKTALNNAAGTCTAAAAVSHTQLDPATVAAATRKTRLCQGVVLLNNVFALLPNVLASAFPAANQAAATAAVNAISTAKNALIAADGTTATIAVTLNQSTCEDNTVVTVPNIESYFAAMFESVFQ